MRRAHSLFLGLATAALAGGVSLDAASAQTPPSGEARGLRYLSWSGRPQGDSRGAALAPAEVRSDLRRPNRVIPHGGARTPPPAGLTPAPGGPRSALTPANAWMRPAPLPTVAPDLAPEPAPPAPPPPARPAPPMVSTPAPVATPAPAAPPPRTLPDYVSNRSGRGQPVPAEVVEDSVTTFVDRAEIPDPMAPRRDAPIFRMQQQTPPPPAAPEPAREEPRVRESADREAPQPRQVALVTANTADRPPAQSARRYSVHRQNGQQPDAVLIPQPTYVDAMAITNMTETPASQDLAHPDQGPTLIRDAQGRIRAQPAAPDGDYQ